MLEKIKKEMGFEFMDLEPLFYEAVLSLEFVPNPYDIVRVLSALDMKNICTWVDRWIEDIEEFNQYREKKYTANTLEKFKTFAEMLHSELERDSEKKTYFIYTPSEEAINAFKKENGIAEDDDGRQW